MKRQEILLIQIFLISLVICGAAYFLRSSTLPPQIPLFYSLTEGERTIVPTYYLSLLPFLSFIIVMINILLYHRLFKHDLFVRKLLYYASVCSIITSTVIFLKIIFLVS